MALTGLGGQRVWSLLVSVFGDLCPDEGAGIDGPVLSALMTAMDVRAEATRVALHRLRNEGWITSQKIGRTSRHSLTPHGRAETLAASRRIYAGPSQMPANWRIIITDSADAAERDAMTTKGFSPLMSRVFIGAADITPPAGGLSLTSEAAPMWLRVQLTPEGLRNDYARLFDILTQIDAALPDGAALAPRDVAVLRCLIVHNWRRLVLKHPDLPAALYTDGWRAHDCRALVSRLLQRFPRPDMTELSD